MTADEAFVKFLHSRADHDLPWEVTAEAMRPIFMAGWHDHARNWVGDKPLVQPPSPDVLAYKGDHDTQPIDFPSVIYGVYPRKTGKLAALKAIAKAMKAIAPKPGSTTQWDAGEVLLERVQAYASAVAQWPASEKQYIPMPATWFNQGRYDDDPKTWLRGAAAVPSQYSKTYK